MRNRWKGTSLLIAGCAALLLSPLPLTALGTEPGMHAAPGAEAGFRGHLSDQLGAAAEMPSPLPAGQSGPEPAPPPGKTPSAGAVTTEPEAVNAGGESKQEPGSADGEMDRQILRWIDALSREKGFEAWPEARRDIYPLGPGTHGWVVILRDGNREIGYMVISATEQGGYRLTEYGTGSKPLFSMDTLYQSLMQLGLIPQDHSPGPASDEALALLNLKRLYIEPMQAVWQLADRGKMRYLDAKTGEELPDISGWLEANGASSDGPSAPGRQPGESSAAPSTDTPGSQPGASPGAPSAPGSQPGGSLGDTAAWEAFDPFERTTWLKGKPLPQGSFEEWRTKVSRPGSRVTFTGKWYGGKALYPLAVTGFHVWTSGLPYIRVEHEGPRYVPFADADRLGRFIP